MSSQDLDSANFHINSVQSQSNERDSGKLRSCLPARLLPREPVLGPHKCGCEGGLSVLERVWHDKWCSLAREDEESGTGTRYTHVQ